MMLKKIINTTAAVLIKKPQRPNVNGPGGIFFLPVNKLGKIAMTKLVELRIINEPTRSEKAVWLPNGIAPRPVPRIAQKRVAGIGQLSPSLT